MRLVLLLLFSSFSLSALCQEYYFKNDQSIPVEVNGKTLSNPWVGGLNAAQIIKTDLNNDGAEDLVVFDKTRNKLLTFIASGEESKLSYEPKYESLFPAINSWIQMVDYDNDGKKDLFCGANAGNVKVFKNVTGPTGNIKFELVTESLYTQGLSGQLPLFISLTDIPSIVDIDNDGDVDFIFFDPSGGHYAQLHKNMSMENTGEPGGLTLKRIGNCWGNFMKAHHCTDVEFGIDCGSSEGMRTMHTGSTVLALDVDNDGDKDLITGGVECNNINLIINGGSAAVANFTSATASYPSENEKPDLKSFLASFYEDVDFDGKKDLIVSPNLRSNEGNLSSFDQSIWFYKNEGSNNHPDFKLKEKDFLQNQMIDLGEYTYPSLFDVDGDGDLDLLVGNRGKIQHDGEFYATMSLFENTGTIDVPSFKLTNTDYLNFSSYKYQNIKPSFADINKDGKLDLVFSSTNSVNLKPTLAYVINTATTGLDVNLLNTVSINFAYSDYDTPILIDVDDDGDLDVLLGRSTGRLEYYENAGGNENFSFSLKTPIVGGIDNDVTAQNLFPMVANLDKDGLDELILTDRSGRFRIAPHWKQQLQGEFLTVTDFLFDELTNSYEVPYAEREVFPTSGDLNNDGFAEIIMGTTGGGLIYLKNEKAIPGLDEEKKNGFEVFPNPSNEKLTIKSVRKGKLQVYSTSGKKIFEKSISENIEKRVDVSFLPKGVYILTFIGLDNFKISEKFIKE